MQLKTIPEDFVVVEKAHHDIKESGPYLLIELSKRNLSTERALSLLADSLHLQRKALGYAGAKDARALTRQYVTIRADETTSEKIKKIKHNQFGVRTLGYLAEPLGLGNLEQNGFEIVVRKIVDERMVPLTKIPNYFDEQRFSTANASIGKHIVKKELKEAVKLIQDTDVEAEPRITEHLQNRPGDSVGALRMMPKHTLLMYVHAYQSLLFNEVLSRYIRDQDPDAVVVDGPIQVTVPTKDIPDIRIPLFGFGTERHPVFGQWYEEILAREGLEPRDFVVRTLPFLTVEGTDREAFFRIDGFSATEPETDDIFPESKKQSLTFTLPKSCYATMVVKCLYRVGRLSGDN